MDYERREITVAGAAGRRVERAQLACQPAGAAESFQLDVRAVFRGALGE